MAGELNWRILPIVDKACASGFRMALAGGVSLLLVSYVNEIM